MMVFERQGYFSIAKLTTVVHWFSHRQRQFKPSQAADSWSEEINRVEKTVAETLSQSVGPVPKAKLTEPLTDHQKVIDLAG